MIDGLVGGKLAGKATQRTSQNGKRFVTSRIRTPQDTGDSILVNVIAFADGVCDALLALDDGDSITLCRQERTHYVARRSAQRHIGRGCARLPANLRTADTEGQI